MNTYDFSGKTVLVTGGTRGIGEAIVEEFSLLGATLIITGTNSEQIKALNKQFPNRTYIETDFTIKKSRDKFLNYLDDTRVDICINCAGSNIIKNNLDCTEKDYDYLHDLNIKAPFLISQKVSKGMLEKQWGRIINIASIWGVITKEKRSLYTSTKSALIGLTRTLAVELSASNILVNTVSPGFTETELTKTSLSQTERAALESNIPIGRFAQPNEIAQVVLFLASNSNTYLTGQNIVTDGGFTIV